LLNAGQHSFEILNDLQVREPEDLDPEALQVGRALPVILHRFWGEVRVPIDLDRELRPWSVEVKDVGIDAVLPAELRAELLASEVVPEPAFAVRRVVPQGFAFAEFVVPVEVLGQNSTSPWPPPLKGGGSARESGVEGWRGLRSGLGDLRARQAGADPPGEVGLTRVGLNWAGCS